MWFFGGWLVACASMAPAAGGDDGSPRLVTIGGAATEIVFALGAGDSVVAVDASSTYPPEVERLPQVGYVRNIAPEGVLSMEPGLVVATGALGPPAARRMLERVDVPTLWLPDPDSAADLRRSVRRVASRLDREKRGETLLEEVGAQLEKAKKRAGEWTGDGPSALFFLEPPGSSSGGMAGGKGSRAAALIRLSGGRNAARDFSGFQPVSRESLLSMNPDVILVGQSEGHGGSAASIDALRNNEALSGVAAVRNGAVHGVPLDDLAFGPRLGEAALRWNRLLAKAAGNDAE